MSSAASIVLMINICGRLTYTKNLKLKNQSLGTSFVTLPFPVPTRKYQPAAISDCFSVIRGAQEEFDSESIQIRLETKQHCNSEEHDIISE